MVRGEWDGMREMGRKEWERRDGNEGMGREE